MSTGLKANVDGSAAIQVGGVDAITLTSAGAASFVTSPMTIQGGSAAAPSLTFSGDTNTGIFSPAADTIAFTEGGVESMRIDSAGRLLIGTTSAIGSWGSAKAQEFQIAASGSRYPGLSCYAFSTTGAGDGAMINLGRSRSTTVGTMTQTQSGDVLGYLIFEGVNSSNALVGGGYISVTQTGSAGSTYIPASMTFFTSDATNGNNPRMVIDPTGNLLVGATSRFSGFAADNKLYVESSTGDYICHFRSTQGTPYGPAISFSTAPNNTTSLFIDARDSSAQRFALRSNGGIANFSANNVNLSDERLKTDIQPAGSYLSKICAIPVKTFRYKDQNDSEPNLGVIAQDVEAVAPELVDASGFGETPEDGVPYKTIYQTDLQYALMKCIQELKAELDATKAEVALLKGAA